MAPEQNQFWQHRSRHGRNYLFASPDALWEAACEYFTWCEANPLYEIDFRGKNVEEVKLPKMRAFTMQGLCRYLDCNTDYFNQFEKGLSGKTDTLSNDFSGVVTRIRETVYEMKYTAAAAGFLNPSIIARDLQLRDNVKNDVAFESLTDDQLNQIIAELKTTITQDDE